jgi:DNA-directed RNA polymerase specialized sigma24 family protein
MHWSFAFMSAPPYDEAHVEELVVRAANADELAWQELWEVIEPKLDHLISQPRFLGRLGRLEDDRRNIVVEVMARIRGERFHRLRLYLAARQENPRLVFWTWMRVVTKRVGIDYLRSHPDYVDRRRSADPGSSPGLWMTPATLPPASQLPGERPSVTSRGTAAELLRHAGGSFPFAQHRALELWIQGQDYADIAKHLELPDASVAEKLVRAAIERLRRHFLA